MERDGWRFVGPALGVTALGVWGVGRGWIWAWPVLCLGVLVAVGCGFFFRDPDRTPPGDPEAVVATADGRILSVVPHPEGGIRIDTFLSVWDVHVNRAPVGGIVAGSLYRPGRFLAAYKPRAGSDNERHDLTINSTIGTIQSAQIAGILARRVVCRVHEGQQLRQGDRIGLIRFGSRAAVIVPRGFIAAVSPGDRVRAGETIIARRVRDDGGRPGDAEA
ncbi:MAG: phosphatidylserine decarboxylase [Candidatus Zixiibacteriota bacterium]